jgi:hypothetical protein
MDITHGHKRGTAASGMHANDLLTAGVDARHACDIGGQRRLTLREEGIARGRAHNQELHEQGHIRRHGGFQRDLPLS